MAEFTDERTMLVGDLEMIHTALANAAGLAATHDLQYQFLQVQQRPKVGKLTSQLRAAQDRVEGYLFEGTDDETGG